MSRASCRCMQKFWHLGSKSYEQHHNSRDVVALLSRHILVTLQVTAPVTWTTMTVVLDTTAASQVGDGHMSFGVTCNRQCLNMLGLILFRHSERCSGRSLADVHCFESSHVVFLRTKTLLQSHGPSNSPGPLRHLWAEHIVEPHLAGLKASGWCHQLSFRHTPRRARRCPAPWPCHGAGHCRSGLLHL